MMKEKSRSPPKRSNGRFLLILACLPTTCKNKKSQSINLSIIKIERNEVKQYGNEICRARYGTVFWNS